MHCVIDGGKTVGYEIVRIIIAQNPMKHPEINYCNKCYIQCEYSQGISYTPLSICVNKCEEEFTKGDKYKQNLNLLTTSRVNILRCDHVLFSLGFCRAGSLPGRRGIRLYFAWHTSTAENRRKPSERLARRRKRVVR